MSRKYVTEADGTYTKVPTAGPLSMEIFVERGHTLSASYHGFRKTLEAEPDHLQDPFYMHVYYGLDHSGTTKRKRTKTENEYASYLTPEGKKIKAEADTKQEEADAKQAETNRKRLHALRVKQAKEDWEREMERRKTGAEKEVALRLEEYKEKNKKDADKAAKAVIEQQVAKEWRTEDKQEEVKDEPVEVKKKAKRVKLELPE
ncbi:hypothetical protein BJ166DRAFT_372344 [Pestalotiopsis sp. NC0098]|nr:hypothetical protein BJ166DRAFT_372344 [Pestalotiopsis sp. NC0098]